MKKINNSLYKLNNILITKWFWQTIAAIAMINYLAPLFINGGVFYTLTFDNLDSNIVWYKILAESGMIFSDNNAIIPNMMSGLPRSSYPSEFNVIVWLYYFFTPQLAYTINEVIIHLTAFFSMYIFLDRYIIKNKSYYYNISIFVGSLYFAFIPYWPHAGLTIAILPLVTYSLLNIKNGISTKFDWLLIILLPLYTSFIFYYMFYIILASLYFIWDTIKNHRLNKPFFLALLLMGTTFLLTEYRLVLTMFSNSTFISHRTEFNIYFNKNLLESYQHALKFFLDGWLQHQRSLMMPILLPFVALSIFLAFLKRRFNLSESVVIWGIAFLSLAVDVWQILLISRYTMPIIFIVVLLLAYQRKEHRLFALLIALQIILSLFNGFCFYDGFAGLTESFPILKMLNISRIAFIQPFIWSIILVLSIKIYFRKLHFSILFITILAAFQLYYGIHVRYFHTKQSFDTISFESYYAPDLFDEIKESMPKPLENLRFVNYGLEPAVALYNGLYTIDGYSTNYPLAYKKRFRRTQIKCLDKHSANAQTYDEWGNKAYLLCIDSRVRNYRISRDKNITLKHIYADKNALCDLHTDYFLSAYHIDSPENHGMKLIDTFKNTNSLWHIWLYDITCQDKNST